MTDNHESVKHVIDALSVVTVLGTLSEMLPSIAALFTIVWTGIRIFETDTVQRMLGRKGGEDGES
jgi:FtsH-binding integral membrane protein